MLFASIRNQLGRAHLNRALEIRALSSTFRAAFCALWLVLIVAGCNKGSYAPPPPPPDTTPPTAPTGLTTTAASDTQINLSWTASTDNVGVTGYKVERCPGAACANFAQIATPTATTFNDTGLTPSTSYSYRVRATDAAGNLSPYSAISTATSSKDITPPSVPMNLATTVISSSQINLSWTASMDDVGVTGYNVQRCQGAGCANFAPIGATTSTTFNDTGLTASNSYSYRVNATDAAGNLSPFSLPATATTPAAGGPISVAISPKRAAVTTQQTQSFSATVTGSSNTSVTWTVDTIPGGNATVGTIDANGKYTPPSTAGTHTIAAISVADITKNASAPIAVTDLAGVFTYHNDLSRDGANTHEFALTTSSVITATFGKLFSCTTDGAIYAQPLWVPNLTIGAAKHNVIIVATQHNSLYAFDADASPCSTLWHVNLTDSLHGGTAGETSVPSGPTGNLVGGGAGDITPEVGVTGTPVIDPATNILYIVSKSVIASGPTFFQRLHGLDVTTGLEKLNGNKPVTISATFPGNADGGTSVAFDPRNEGQRAGLALVNGVVYIAWASHEDQTPYHGWVLAYDKTSLIQTAAYNDSPNGRQGGIWMSGGAPAVDANNSLYVITGNGDFDGVTDFGDSILKLSTGLSLMDSFTPSVQLTLDQSDLDLGSGGAVILVDTPSAPAGLQHLLIGGGKGPTQNGILYVANRDNLGQNTANDSGIVQEFTLGSMVYATGAFWLNNLYIAGVGGSLTAFSFTPSTGQFNATPTSQSVASYGFPGATPSVSSNAAASGIVWAIDTSQYCTNQSPGCGPAVLHAYDATTLNTELWNSSQVVADQAGRAVKFAVPTVANGKVYIGTRGNDCSTSCNTAPTIPGELDVYGLKPN